MSNDVYQKGEFLKQLSRAKSYIKAKKRPLLKKYIGNVVTLTQIDNWIDNPDHADPGRKKLSFTVEMKQVPDVRLHDDVVLYNQVLDRASLKIDSQEGLARHRINFKVVLPEHHIDTERNIDGVTLIGFRRPTFVTFSLYYREQIPKVRRNKCNGLVIKRGNKNYIIGTGSNTTLMAHCVDAEYSEAEPSFGYMTFECIRARVFFQSNFALIDQSAPELEHLIYQARHQLNRNQPHK